MFENRAELLHGALVGRISQPMEQLAQLLRGTFLHLFKGRAMNLI